MDDRPASKKNSDIHSLADIEAVRHEAQRQVMVALVLMLAGLSLAIAGLAGLMWRLARLASLGFFLRNRRTRAISEVADRVRSAQRL